MKNTILILVIILSAINDLISQGNFDEHGVSYGLLTHISFSNHQSDLRAIPSRSSEIPFIASGTNNGFSFGAFAEIPIKGKLSMMFRGYYLSQDSEIKKTGSYSYQIDGELVEGEAQNIVAANLSSVRFEYLLKMNIWKGFSLLGGFYAGIRLDGDYTYTLNAVSPENALFSNGSRELDKTDPPLEDASLQAAFTGGISYEFWLDTYREWGISIEGLYSLGMAEVAKDFTWDANSFRFGIGFKYSPFTPQETPEEMAGIIK